MRRCGGKILVPGFSLTLASFIILCCVSAPFVYVGFPEGILLGFYASIYFQWNVAGYVIDKSIATEYVVSAQVVDGDELVEARWKQWAYGKAQAKEFFWEQAEKKDMDVIGEPEIVD